MKKLVYLMASLLILAGLTSCDAEIKNASIKNLIGTWDLVSETTVGYNGSTSTENYAKGESYLVIREKEIEQHTGKISVTNPFSFGDPYLIIDGTNRYEIVSLSYKTMVLKDNLALLVKQRTLTYQRR